MAPFQLYCLVTNGFRLLSFEKIRFLDSYFIHRYIIIKYRPSLNLGIIDLLLWELWPLFGFIYICIYIYIYIYIYIFVCTLEFHILSIT